MPGRSHLHVLFTRLFALAAFLAAIWALQGLNSATGIDLSDWLGLIPRSIAGLDGIVAMPFLHGGFEHLMANTPPLVVMGGLLAATATRALVAVNAVIVLVGGGLVWLLGSPAIHIGASGLVFGWFGFLVTRALVDRSTTTLICALIVGFLYGSILVGVLPGQPGISWEAHLFGAIAGALAAIFVKSHVHAPRLRDVERL
ncbi:MAG: rhomboid family intramembrane serine protease [Pseudomonadota bacterium]